ncbi:hypothetical protein [Providencia sneebia]|nr:hypothetical protein [Providencia sneebia]
MNKKENMNSLVSDVLSAAAPTAPTADVSTVSQVITGTGPVALDLVIIIDTSGSMSDESQDLSDQIDAAIQNASEKCPSRLRATFLGIQGTWDNTKFDQSVSDYLIGRGVKEANLQARAPFKEADGLDHRGNREDLCRAVIDASKYFDWRENARRAIFVLGDEGMEGGGGILTQAAIDKNDEAISVAQQEQVKVYTYQGTPNDDPSNLDSFPSLADRDKITKEYERLAEQTGGRSYIYTTGIANFSLVLQEILCDSLNPPAKPNVNGKANCESVCEQLPTILATIGRLAEILNKAIDACCKDDHDDSKKDKKLCRCKH